jgi:hypothetical protein
MSKEVKADLTLLKEMVTVLETQLEEAYMIRNSFKNDKSGEVHRQFIIEVSKSVGILSGIAGEASLLIGDLQKIMQYSYQNPYQKDSDSADVVSTILSSIKGSDTGGTRN